MHKVKLSEICTIVSGGTPSRAKPEYWQNGTIPWIKIGNINTKWVDSADEYITEAGFNNSSAKMLSKGTILYTIFATLGEVGILKIAACTNQAIAGITINDSEKVIPDYLYYYLKSKKPFVNGIGRGVAQNNINMTILRSFEVPLPNYQDQKIIVDILEKVSTSIELRKRELHSLDTLIKARFVEMFGDPIRNEKGFETKSGEDVFKLSNGKFVPEHKRLESGIPVYGGNGISWFTDEILSEEDTVVVGRVGFQSGNVHLAEGPLWISDNAMYISELYDSDYDLRFLYWVMEHIDFTRYQDAGDLKKITQKPFMQMKYIKPPIYIQREYNAFVAQVDKSKFAVQKALEKSQLLFDSLMQQYFG